MRFIALALLGGAVLMTVGCSSSRSFSRKEVMADHIASVRPDGSSYATTTHARRASEPVVTYTSAPRTSPRYSIPAPPPPPAMPGMTTYVSRPAAPAATRSSIARPAARAAAPVRRAPTTTTYCEPCPPKPCAPRKAAGFKLFGGCIGGT